uniref:Homeobox domain-containing protein n=1 Tax=Glossina austeni TaxID=7395 RepID=A0A1A9V6H9_GLOAU
MISNKRKRAALINTLTDIQLSELGHEFEKSSYLRAERSILISERLNISVQVVQAWFSQQREYRRNVKKRDKFCNSDESSPQAREDTQSNFYPRAESLHINICQHSPEWWNALNHKSSNISYSRISPHQNVLNQQSPYNSFSNVTMRVPLLSIRTNIGDITPPPLNYTPAAPIVNNLRVNASSPSSVVTNSIPINRTIDNEEILTYEEIVAVIKASPDLCYSDEIVAILDNTVF